MNAIASPASPPSVFRRFHCAALLLAALAAGLPGGAALQARIITEDAGAAGFPSDAAFAQGQSFALDASLGAAPSAQNFTITQGGEQFAFSTTDANGAFRCFGPGNAAPPCSVFVTQIPITVTVDPPVAALGFVFENGEIMGTVSFTGENGSESFTAPFGSQNLLIAAADLGPIRSATLSGLFSSWTALHFSSTGAPPPPPNLPPTAGAGPDQSVALPAGSATAAVTLDGSGSTDADGTVQEYRWSGFPDPDNVAGPTVNLGAGVHRFTLIVVDDDGAASAADEVEVTVRGIGIASPRNGDTVRGNAVAVVAVIGSPAAVSAVRLTFQPQGSGGPAILIAQVSTYPFTAPWDTTGIANGVYELQATALLLPNGELASAPVAVTVDNSVLQTSPDIEESVGASGILRKDQELRPGEDNTIYTSDGARVTFPAADVPAGATGYTIERRDPSLAPGNFPGEACGPLTVLLTALSPLPEPVGLELPYPDLDQDGLVDGSASSEVDLTIWYFDSSIGWIPMPDAAVDAELNVIRVPSSVELPKQFAIIKPGAPLIERGPRNPSDLTIQDSGTGPAVQARIAAGYENLEVTSVQAVFETIDGEAADVRTLTAALVEDANGNGRADAGEEILGIETRDGLPDSITWTLQEPLRIPRATTNNLLVVLGINNAAEAPEGFVFRLPGADFWKRWSWILLLPCIPFLASALQRLPRRAPQWSWALLLFLSVGFCFSQASCHLFEDDDSETIELPPPPEVPEPTPPEAEPLEFDVIIRINGIAVEGMVSESAYLGPRDRDIQGARVELRS